MKNISRRNFIKNTSGAVLGLGAFNFLRPSISFAAVPGGSGRNIIAVNLGGGADGLNIFPFYSGAVADTINTVCRPNIFISPDKVLPASAQSSLPNKLGFHPSFAPLINTANLQGAKMRLLKRVGITTDPGRSHERCQNLYSIGALNQSPGQEYGWLARAMDLNCFDTFQVFAFGSLGDKIDFKTQKERPLVIGSMTEYNYLDRTPGNFDCGNGCKIGNDKISTATDDTAYAREIADELRTKDGLASPLSDKFKQTLAQIKGSVGWVQSNIITQTLTGDYAKKDPTTGAPLSLTGFANNCRDCAKVIKFLSSASSGYENKTKIFYLERGGWDTHSTIGRSLTDNIDDVSAALSGLIQDLSAAGLINNTVIYLYTEFGRTNFQNGTDPTGAGTDHGYANTHLVIGGGVSAGVVGDDPTDAELRDNTKNCLTPTIDFRRPLHEILAWGGIDPALIFTESYTSRSPLGIFSGTNAPSQNSC